MGNFPGQTINKAKESKIINKYIDLYKKFPSSSLSSDEQIARDLTVAVAQRNKLEALKLLNKLDSSLQKRFNIKIIGNVGNSVQKSNNIWNAEFERITKTYKGQELQTKLKEFLKTLPTDDPIAKSIRSVSKNLFNV